MSNQDIQVSGENNVIRVFGSGKLKVGNQSIDVSGANNSVTVASTGTLRIGGQQAAHPPPTVCRGQVWAHLVLAPRYQVISVRDGIARCLVTDTNGKPITGPDGKATIQDLSTINLRYAYTLVNG